MRPWRTRSRRTTELPGRTHGKRLAAFDGTAQPGPPQSRYPGEAPAAQMRPKRGWLETILRPTRAPLAPH